MKLLFGILLLFTQSVFADEDNFFLECKGVHQTGELLNSIEYDDVKVFKVKNGKIQIHQLAEGLVTVNIIDEENISYYWGNDSDFHSLSINRISGLIFEHGLKKIGNNNISWSFKGNCIKGSQKF